MFVYIDESGNIGSGGGRYFVIAAVVSISPKHLKNVVKRYRKSAKVSEIKGSKISFQDRQRLLRNIFSSEDHKVVYLVFDKEKFHRKDLLGKNILFNYLFSFLIVPLLEQCSTLTQLYFDNRTVKTNSKYSLPDYIKTKLIELDKSAEIDISFYESHNSCGIQVADLVANTVYRKYLKGHDHCYGIINVAHSEKFPYQQFGQ